MLDFEAEPGRWVSFAAQRAAILSGWLDATRAPAARCRERSARTVTQDPEVESLGFEAALERLERTVRDLESGKLGLDQALGQYQLGVRLLAQCYRVLERAERSVAVITGLDATGNPRTAPFDATATVERDHPVKPPEPAAPYSSGEPDPLDEDSVPF
jgi:exodeoxyribonuclease VII small subunit